MTSSIQAMAQVEEYYVEVSSLVCKDCGRELNAYPVFEMEEDPAEVVCASCCLKRAGFSGRLR